MTNEQAIETLSIELKHTESHMRIEGKASEYYEELSQIAEALRMSIEALKNEKQQGKWIKTVMFGEKCLECDQCGKVDFNIRHYKFCPDCGVKMKEDSDGKTV